MKNTELTEHHENLGEQTDKRVPIKKRSVGTHSMKYWFFTCIIFIHEYWAHNMRFTSIHMPK